MSDDGNKSPRGSSSPPSIKALHGKSIGYEVDVPADAGALRIVHARDYLHAQVMADLGHLIRRHGGLPSLVYSETKRKFNGPTPTIRLRAQITVRTSPLGDQT
jgi:hypothetical protein